MQDVKAASAWSARCASACGPGCRCCCCGWGSQNEVRIKKQAKPSCWRESKEGRKDTRKDTKRRKDGKKGQKKGRKEGRKEAGSKEGRKKGKKRRRKNRGKRREGKKECVYWVRRACRAACHLQRYSCCRLAYLRMLQRRLDIIARLAYLLAAGLVSVAVVIVVIREAQYRWLLCFWLRVWAGGAFMTWHKRLRKCRQR